MISTLPAGKKSYKEHNCDQGTDEWYELRRQYPLTASNAQAISAQGAGLDTLVFTKMSEKYSSEPFQEHVSSRHIDRGNELEEHAREIYELETGETVREVGFVTDKSISHYGGASPDGLVGEEGLMEIKCFEDVKYFKMIIDHNKGMKFDIEKKYYWQMQQQMLFTGRPWCDFVAYNPNFKQSLLIQRVEANKDDQEKIIGGLKKGEQLIKDIEKNYNK